MIREGGTVDLLAGSFPNPQSQVDRRLDERPVWTGFVGGRVTVQLKTTAELSCRHVCRAHLCFSPVTTGGPWTQKSKENPPSMHVWRALEGKYALKMAPLVPWIRISVSLVSAPSAPLPCCRSAPHLILPNPRPNLPSQMLCLASQSS